jgi:hypothetical protein
VPLPHAWHSWCDPLEVIAYGQGCAALNTGVADGRLAHEDCVLFLSIATRKPPLSVPRFAALVNDFASIARNENTADALLAYEM